MFQEYLLSNFVNIVNKTKTSWELILLIIVIIFSCSSTCSAPITTVPSSNYHHLELISNSYYRNFFLRQYFIDLLNISHSSLIQSMIKNHHLATELEQNKNRKRRFIANVSFATTPRLALHSINCLNLNDRKVQSTFQSSFKLELLSSIELIYHIDRTELKKSPIPIHISIKQPQTSMELFSIDTYLQVDPIRDLYFLNIYDYFLRINNQNLIIETAIQNQTCQTSHTYIILSSSNSTTSSSYDLQPTTMCKIRTIQITFEELGLAYLIIRPKEYTFTYCDGSCSDLTFQQQLQQPSIYTLIQSIISKKVSKIPQRTCVPSQFSDDNFLLRQTDGSMEIYPVKDVIVKKCACL
ncbi:unnamed protein product [Rotaria socialis]|uniref:TGF-beta family profile domain-containing protein n=1 Tax=Rotaria socialis TaxID=392032 RepID=A0A819VFY0_9BILA|nr:unnamed protein product [Rotaria socialis]CAF3390818.1 unnamed protein product [Rotaria socialis]CAF3466348.1 unnamed protein product [Rotaria socialis]CAF3517024.1 unnamed protein product [Rotaria socialis]CAF3617443.1 unnamed protein product [Rotaria socialis]